MSLGDEASVKRTPGRSERRLSPQSDFLWACSPTNEPIGQGDVDKESGVGAG